jgi:hypothetical protein
MKQSAGLAVLAAVLAVAACGGGDDTPGGITPDESRQLNEAAEMLDASPDSLAAPDETGLGAAAGNAAGVNAAGSEDSGALPVSGEAANGQ